MVMITIITHTGGLLTETPAKSESRDPKASPLRWVIPFQGFQGYRFRLSTKHYQTLQEIYGFR